MHRLDAYDQLRKFSYCIGMPTCDFSKMLMSSWRSSIFLPVTRTCSSMMDAWTLEAGVFDDLDDFLRGVFVDALLDLDVFLHHVAGGVEFLAEVEALRVEALLHHAADDDAFHGFEAHVVFSEDVDLERLLVEFHVGLGTVKIENGWRVP